MDSVIYRRDFLSYGYVRARGRFQQGRLDAVANLNRDSRRSMKVGRTP